VNSRKESKGKKGWSQKKRRKKKKKKKKKRRGGGRGVLGVGGRSLRTTGAPQCTPPVPLACLESHFTGSSSSGSKTAQLHTRHSGSARVEHHLLIVIFVLELNNECLPPLESCMN
jgi:hypothetical protein